MGGYAGYAGGRLAAAEFDFALELANAIGQRLNLELPGTVGQCLELGLARRLAGGCGCRGDSRRRLMGHPGHADALGGCLIAEVEPTPAGSTQV